MDGNELLLKPGEVVFSEGEPSEHVALVVEGEVEVVRRLGSREVVLGVIGAGEHVGETGVLEGRSRLATVRARTRVRLRFLDRPTFIRRVSTDRELAYELLLRLSERLRRADDRIAALAPTAGVRAATGGDLPRARLFAASPELEGQLPEAGLLLKRLPFAVGRQPSASERAPALAVDLPIRDERPYRLSRSHFAVSADEDGLFLVDTGSKLGTVVDGIPLGEVFARRRLRLAPGEHEILAGGAHSPYRFRLLVESGSAVASEEKTA